MHTITRPTGDQPFRIGNGRLCVLNHVALDVAPLAVSVSGVTLRSEVDGKDTILPEDIGAESGQPSHSTVVAGFGDEVALEEMDAGGREFHNFGQVDTHEVFHAGEAHWGVLQDVDWRVVRFVSRNDAESERVDASVFRLNLFGLPPIQRFLYVVNIVIRPFRTLIHIRCALTVAREFGLYLCHHLLRSDNILRISLYGLGTPFV